MRFDPIRCRRNVREQNYIIALCGLWDTAPDSVRDRISEYIKSAAQGDAAAGRALFSVLIRGKSPKAAAASAGVELGQLYEMRREFMNAFPIL